MAKNNDGIEVGAHVTWAEMQSANAKRKAPKPPKAPKPQKPVFVAADK
jgi:hypothetical protein